MHHAAALTYYWFRSPISVKNNAFPHFLSVWKTGLELYLKPGNPIDENMNFYNLLQFLKLK